MLVLVEIKNERRGGINLKRGKEKKRTGGAVETKITWKMKRKEKEGKIH